MKISNFIPLRTIATIHNGEYVVHAKIDCTVGRNVTTREISRSLNERDKIWYFVDTGEVVHNIPDKWKN